MAKITFTTVPDADDVAIDGVSMKDITAFRLECLSGGAVTCDWDTLRVRLENNDVSRFWWFLTEAERRSIAEMAVKNTLFYFISHGRYGKPNCKGGEGDFKNIVCVQNALIRYLKFGSDNPPGGDTCYYKHPITNDEFCYVPDAKYGLPCCRCSCRSYDLEFAHSMCALQVNEDFKKFDSWIFFQYSDFDIKPGNWQMPIDKYPGNIYVKVAVVTSLQCNGCSGYELMRWDF